MSVLRFDTFSFTWESVDPFMTYLRIPSSDKVVPDGMEIEEM